MLESLKDHKSKAFGTRWQVEENLKLDLSGLRQRDLDGSGSLCPCEVE
jgi:hypothetical protein